MAPQRIVSLCPSITKTLVAIGGFKRLVGAARYCVRPKGMLWGLLRIGGTKDPDIAQDHCTVLTFIGWTWSQGRMSAVHGAIILALEPVFATLFAAWLLHERLGPRGLPAAPSSWPASWFLS